MRHSIFDYVVINEQFFITVPKLRYKITLRHSIFDQVLINKQFFITAQKIFKKNYSRLFLSTTLSSIRIVIGTNVTVLRWYTFFFCKSEARVAWISSDCFESFSPLSRDVTEGVIMTQSNRIKFRLSKYFSVHQFASPVYFSQPASADQIWKMLSIIPSLTVTILCHWRHFEDVIQEKWRDSQAGWV